MPSSNTPTNAKELLDNIIRREVSEIKIKQRGRSVEATITVGERHYDYFSIKNGGKYLSSMRTELDRLAERQNGTRIITPENNKKYLLELEEQGSNCLVIRRYYPTHN